MSQVTHTVSFVGESSQAKVDSGASVLQAARDAGVDIVATCGGRGRCRSCRVKVVEGTLPPPTLADIVQLGDQEVREHYRLSCQLRVNDNIAVQVSPPLHETAFQILVDTEVPKKGLTVDCGVHKVHVQPTLPTDENDATSDLEEVLRGTGLTPALSLDTVRRLPDMLRQSSAGLTITTFDGTVLSLESGDTTKQAFGLALDIGTTTVIGYLIDLISGETMATVPGLNPQAVFGGDLMSRIAFAMESTTNVRKLRSRLIGFINEQIGEACSQGGIQRKHIYKIVVVGNSCMHHLFLGIDPKFLGCAPYAPAMRSAYACAAREVGLKVADGARLFMLPLVAGFVGADTLGMILSTHLEVGSKIRVAVDIGTNAEAVMGGQGSLLACSSPAGPALEGAQIRCGMRAAAGAIERVSVDQDIHVQTIGGVPAVGVCGSGLVDAIAALLDAGVLTTSGRMIAEGPLPAAIDKRLRTGKDGIAEFVLVWAGDGGARQDLVLTQADIRQVQLAKAAISSGVAILQHHMGVTDGDIDEFMLAGAFGNYLGMRSVRRIGLIPDLPPSRIRFVANAAGLGAQMALLSESERQRAELLGQRIEHITLATHPEFQKVFLDAISFPEEVAAYSESD